MRYVAVLLFVTMAACSQEQAVNGSSANVAAARASAACNASADPIPMVNSPSDPSAGVHRQEALSDSPIGSGGGCGTDQRRP
jgi:hypothetical protein